VRRAVLAAISGLLLLPSAVPAHYVAEQPPSARIAQADGVAEPCPGVPLRADRVMTGSFSTAQQGSYVMVPFTVPAGVTSVRVKYCYDQPESPLSAQLKHTLDLGLYGARRPGELWGEREFRGWGGSSHPDVTVSPQGFSTEEQYEAEPRGVVPGRTTRGYLPGPIESGEWAAELGVAAVVPQSSGDADGRVAWRVEVQLDGDPAFAADPYRPAPYDPRPARTAAGWYAGDLHVHTEHSSLGDATTRETLDYAFAPPPQGAGLDFVTVTDYVTSSNWGELGRHQARYPGRLVARSAEIITYRGHTQNQLSLRYVDHRTGPVLELAPDGTLVPRRAARTPRPLFDAIHGAGGFTQVNHPTIFPSEVPGFANLCRGCPWDYSDEETDWSRVDAYEVATGPPGNDVGPNPFTLTAIDEYDRLRRAGHRLAALGVSDSHNAGRTPNPVTQAPVGTGATVVFAPSLSEAGVRDGVLRGRTYVKVFGPGSADLRLTLRNERGEAMIGGALEGERATLAARVFGGADVSRTLVVLRDGRQIASVPVSGPDFEHTMMVSGKGDYRIQVMRGASVDGLTTPITLGMREPPPRAVGGGASAGTPAAGRRPRLRLRVLRTRRSGRFVRVRLRVTARGRPVRRALVRAGRRKARTGRRGRATLRVRAPRARRVTVRASAPGRHPGRLVVRIRRPPSRR
jgi:hypothetical protein